jgi:hypothetical protein
MACATQLSTCVPFVRLGFCPDGESDITIWNRGLELTPTDARHRFAEVSQLPAKLETLLLRVEETREL